jgi:hypothetical protein
MLLGVHRDASALRPAADPRVGAATPGAPLASSIRDGSDDISDKQILESMREKNQRRQIYTQQRLRTCICEGPKTGIPGGICCATKQRYKGFLPRVPPIIPARDRRAQAVRRTRSLPGERVKPILGVELNPSRLLAPEWARVRSGSVSVISSAKSA